MNCSWTWDNAGLSPVEVSTKGLRQAPSWLACWSVFPNSQYPPWAMNQPPSPQFNLFLRTKPSPSLFLRGLKRMKPPDFNQKKWNKHRKKTTFWGICLDFSRKQIFWPSLQATPAKGIPKAPRTRVSSHLKMGLGGGATGVIGTHFGGIKRYKSMVTLRHCLGW